MGGPAAGAGQPPESNDWSGRFFALAFGFAPAALFLLTWPESEHKWWLNNFAVPVLAVEIAVVVVAVREGLRIRLTPILGAAILLLLLAWITALLAPSPGIALVRTGIWTIHLLFGFAAARLFSAEQLIDGVLAGFALLVGLLALFVVLAPPAFDWIYQLPGFTNIRRLGFYAAAVISLCLGKFAGGQWRYMAIAAAAFAVVFWSGTRGAVAATGAGLVIAMALFPALRAPRVWGSFLASALAGWGIAMVIGSPDQIYGPSRMADMDDNRRFEIWRLTVGLIGERPWFGYGEGQLTDLARLKWVTHPHNLVLQLLLAWGAAGLALATLLGGWASREMARRADERSLPLISAALILTIYSMVDSALYQVHSAAIFAACVGVALARRSNG